MKERYFVGDLISEDFEVFDGGVEQVVPEDVIFGQSSPCVVVFNLILSQSGFAVNLSDLTHGMDFLVTTVIRKVTNKFV
jgi:hypothetical protein